MGARWYIAEVEEVARLSLKRAASRASIRVWEPYLTVRYVKDGRWTDGSVRLAEGYVFLRGESTEVVAKVVGSVRGARLLQSRRRPAVLSDEDVARYEQAERLAVQITPGIVRSGARVAVRKDVRSPYAGLVGRYLDMGLALRGGTMYSLVEFDMWGHTKVDFVPADHIEEAQCESLLSCTDGIIGRLGATLSSPLRPIRSRASTGQETEG